MKSAATTILASFLVCTLVAASVPQAARAGAVARGKLISDAGTDPFWNNVVFLAGNDNNITGQTSFVDQSRYIHSLTANGNASTTVATAPTGLTSSIALDGTGDYISLSDSDDFNVGSGDFTVEAEYRQTSAGDGAVASQWASTGSSDTNSAWEIIVSSGTLYGQVAVGTTVYTVTTAAPSAGTWRHVALTRSGTTLRLFVDGSSVGTPATVSGTVNNSTNGPRIGARAGSNDFNFNGHIAGIRITKGVARYTSNFTPPVLPLKVAAYEPIQATGGTVTTVGGYKVHTFTSSGTFRVLRGTGHIWYLVVGGGGGGGGNGNGGWAGGGGGAGGYRTNGIYNFPVSTGSYTVTVGAGGVGGAGGTSGAPCSNNSNANGSDGNNGGDSSFSTITSMGGGGGGKGYDTATNGKNGGSGGGGGAGNTLGGASGGPGTTNGGTGSSGQGNAGAGDLDGTNTPGAGGGAGGAAVEGAVSTPGVGISSSINGFTSTYAARGGISSGNPATAGAANRGNGGSGGSGCSVSGGNGGSGIVIIRYPIGNSTAKAPPSSSLVGWWTLDNADVSDKIYDRSGRGNNGYFFNGATSSAKVAGNIGQALDFDGVDDFINFGSNTIVNDGGSITYSVWIKPSAVIDYGSVGKFKSTSELTYNVGKSGNTNLAGHSVLFGFRGNNYIYSDDSRLLIDNMMNRWHHLVFQYNGGTKGSASSWNLYFDGTAVALSAGTAMGGATNVNEIGRDSASAGFFTGPIDDPRVYNRALSAAEVAALYASNKTVPKVNTAQVNSVTNGLVGYWDFDNKNIYGTTAYDRSGQGNNGTLTNGPTKGIGKIGQALRFDGSDDYINVAHSSSLEAAGNLTISLWLKPTALPLSTNIGFVAKRSLSVGGSSRYHFGINNDLSGYNFYNGTSEYQSAQRPAVGVWSHVAMVLTSGTNIKYYTNGALVDTIAGATIGSATGDPVTIGASWTDTKFNGAIDEVRIYNRALSAAEVKRLYNIGR